jgi:hypothetical protein
LIVDNNLHVVVEFEHARVVWNSVKKLERVHVTITTALSYMEL